MTTFLHPRQVFKVLLAFLAVLPAVIFRLGGMELPAVTGIGVYGAAIVGAAFILLWAGEAAQVDVAGGLALAALAIIAVLPEYAVDLYFAFTAGSQPEFAAFAAANMTGSNRLLLGFGWPAVVLSSYIAYGIWRRRQRNSGTAVPNSGTAVPNSGTAVPNSGSPSQTQDSGVSLKPFAVNLLPEARIDLGILMVASLLVLIVPITGELHIGLSVVLFVLFSWYLYLMSKTGVGDPDLSGISASIADLPKRTRRTTVIVMLVLSAFVILLVAESFANSLVEGGRMLGIDDFLLVQWLAPLASESPEFLLAFVMAFSGRSAMAIGILIASKVNQWTLLVGSLPVAYVVGGGDVALPMDGRQVEEFVLTIAQTLLGVAFLLGLRFSWRSATALFLLFSATFVFTSQESRWIVAIVYLVIAGIIFAVRSRALLSIVKAPFQKEAFQPEDPS